ncbi:hypothetical protein AB0C14_37695 [Microbispora hainanensis]|uniref:hypothetical protein n=1 Tax=Microbispora hainanensis TaxID=568844 RepID=UPI0033F4A71E
MMTEVETFRLMGWTWDVSAAKKYAASRHPGGHLRPRHWAGLLALIDIDQAHAELVDLSEPLIAVPASPRGGALVIDGWHRIARALREGVTELPVILLSKEEEYACRIHGGSRCYGWA